MALLQGHTETLALLLANKADLHVTAKVLITIRSFKFILPSIQFGNHILQLAAEYGHFDSAELLLSAKVCLVSNQQLKHRVIHLFRLI
jgi:ankyrin repeat protein